MQKIADCGIPIFVDTYGGRCYTNQIWRVMRLTVFLLTAALIHVHASGTAQEISLTGKDLTLKLIFTAIEKQTGYVVFADENSISGAGKVSVSVHNMPLKNFLNTVLKNQPLEYVIQGK